MDLHDRTKPNRRKVTMHLADSGTIRFDQTAALVKSA